jgi:hypothetical protein
VFAHDSSKADAFAQMRAAGLDLVSVHPTRGSWAQTLNPWWLDKTQAYRTQPGVRLEIAVPSYAYDLGVKAAQSAQWKQFGQQLVARGEPDAIIRLAWEMNLPQWRHACTPSNKRAWVARWREAVTALRSVPGQRFTIAFISNEGPTQTGLQADGCWPGDSYVDVVGVDYYDQWEPIRTGAERDARFARDRGLGWWLSFARSHGKRFALPEWGVSSGTQWAGHAGGDNPFFVRSVYGWLSANRQHVAYEGYFEEAASFVVSALMEPTPNDTARAEYQAQVALLRTTTG